MDHKPLPTPANIRCFLPRRDAAVLAHAFAEVAAMHRAHREIDRTGGMPWSTTRALAQPGLLRSPVCGTCHGSGESQDGCTDDCEACGGSGLARQDRA